MRHRISSDSVVGDVVLTEGSADTTGIEGVVELDLDISVVTPVGTPGVLDGNVVDTGIRVVTIADGLEGVVDGVVTTGDIGGDNTRGVSAPDAVTRVGSDGHSLKAESCLDGRHAVRKSRVAIAREVESKCIVACYASTLSSSVRVICLGNGSGGDVIA